MDISDVNKVAIRKRLNTDAETLRNKVSRESSKVIKLRVAQDTAYWDVQTRLAGVEKEHERLQQNMLDVQMEHEKLSATYQDELRLRPEVLNKLASTREICDVLEEYAGRVRQSLRRCAADRAVLAQFYASAAQRVHSVHAQHTKSIEQANEKVHQLTEKLNSSTQHNAQLMSLASDAQRQSEAREAAARAQLSAAAGMIEDLRGKCELMAEKSYSFSAELIVQKRCIVELKQEAERRAAESQAEADAAAAMQDKLQKQVKTLSQDLASSEARVESASKECTRLQDLLVAAEHKAVYFTEETERLKGAVKTLEATGVDLKRELDLSKANTETLNKVLDQKECEIREYNARLEETRRVLDETRESLDKTDSKLRSTTETLEAERKARAEESAAAKNELEALETRNAAAAAATERALAERAETVAALMRDVAAESSARVRAEAMHCAARAQLDLAAQARDDLNNKLQAKEKELAGQMKVIIETRKEKDRLQENIRDMQATIENIHKELVRPPKVAAAAAERRELPEHDDNARDAAPSPTKMNKKVVVCPNSQNNNRGLFRSPLAHSGVDDALYHLLSDSSVDGEMLKPVKGKARYEAKSHGDAPPLTSLNSLKRHNELPAATRNEEISMSQVRADLVNRGRSFFRNKPRPDAKQKKSKK